VYWLWKVFELQEKEGKTLSVVVAEDECIVCRACEVQCSEEAIEVIE
jgi:NAD-dependent dihydropyrimidine dehydrogenase PreA subunit